MDGEFTGKEIYQDLFSPRGYLDTYYDPKKGILVTDGFLDFALRKLYEAFTTRGVKGEVLIDIGHGPTIYQDLSACAEATTVEEKREKLRNTVKRTVKCDVTKTKPLDPLVLPQIDCVMTLGCLECACKDLDTYRDLQKSSIFQENLNCFYIKKQIKILSQVLRAPILFQYES
ncbi:indolethylamine N-methyltransferase-like [Spea bombifrons]|uniref:indolethylamine N-methyltransferase-like n=1 Tax=Spea bombifrons TaxID=233779 RepID=UPI0023496BF0|nr:indolethylamine N-methyltransferase-like [Spea bombifrons]